MTDSSDIIPDESLSFDAAPEPSESDHLIPPEALAAPIAKAEVKDKAPSIANMAKDAFDTSSDATRGTLRRMAKGVAGSVIGGWAGIESLVSDAAAGQKPDFDKATAAIQGIQDKMMAGDAAKTPTEIAQQEALQSPWNPINYPTILGRKAGELEGQLGGGPALQTFVDTGTNLASSILGAKAISAATSSKAPAAVEGAGAPASVPADFDSPPVEGGLPDESQASRAQVLQRIGLDRTRNSAIEGNAKTAATDFQLTRFDEPAGVAAKAQFDSEREALHQHAENIVKDTGGTLGADEDTLNARGQAIAAPFDQLRQWFDTQKKKLYGAADAKAAGAPIGDISSVDKLLKDPDFTETLLAKDQGGLLSSVQRQWERFKGLNPGGMDVAGAENFRKWLNQVWTPENSATLGKVKGALDDAVFKGAGEDVYGPARQLAQMEYQTLDNPNGISRLMDADPKNPLNRTTPHVKIPDSLTRLDPANFSNVFKTLDTMPEEIQPAAEAAKAEIKAHLANKLLDAGSSEQGQWASGKVSKVLKANSAKLQIAFEDQPEILNKIKDLDSAGKILRVNQSYPGAAAQAANALKRGLLSRAVSKVSAATGALAGSAAGGAMGVPTVGAGVGAAAGESFGSAIGQGMAERSALARWNAQTTSLRDLLRPEAPK